MRTFGSGSRDTWLRYSSAWESERRARDSIAYSLTFRSVLLTALPRADKAVTSSAWPLSFKRVSAWSWIALSSLLVSATSRSSAPGPSRASRISRAFA